MVPALLTTFKIVDAIASGEGNGSIQALSRRLDLAPATCFRVLKTLQDQRWIDVDGETRRIGHGLTKLARPVDTDQRLINVARPFLHALAAETGLSAKLSVRQGWEGVTIDRVDSPREFAVVGRTGSRFSLAIGSSGAALAASLSADEIKDLIDSEPDSTWRHQKPADFRSRLAQIRANRWCVDRGSYLPHVHTLSAIVRAGSETVAALTLIGMPDDLPQRAVPGLKRSILKTAASIEARLAVPVRSSPKPKRKGDR